MRISLLFVIVAVLLLSLGDSVFGRLREGECEVCLKRVADFQSELGKLKTQPEIEAGIKRMCKQWPDKADQRFCYYIGGTDDAATSLLRSISQSLINHFPPTKICESLKKADGQICTVKYDAPPKEIDWDTVDLNKMRVKELKQILDKWGEKCEGCTDKSDYVRTINSLRPKHVTAKAEL